MSGQEEKESLFDLSCISMSAAPVEPNSPHSNPLLSELDQWIADMGAWPEASAVGQGKDSDEKCGTKRYEPIAT